MTPAQLYQAIADILGIDVTEAQTIANHLMALVLGRNTTESSSWRTAPPAMRNDLQTTEKMPTKLLNALNNNVNSSTAAVNSFSDRVSEAVGNQYADDQEAFEALGGNLIQIVKDIKVKIDSGEIGGTIDITPLSETELDEIFSEVFSI